MFFRLLLESFRRQRRRKLLAGIAIFLGTTAVTAMLALATTIGDRIHQELAVYGANIVITPKAANLPVKVGGIDIQPATANAYLHESDLNKLKTIFWANNITGLSPELDIPLIDVTSYERPIVKNERISAVGMRFRAESVGGISPVQKLHLLWRVQGSWPSPIPANRICSGYCNEGEVVVGTSFAKKHGIRFGDNEKTVFYPIDLAAPGKETEYPHFFMVVGIASTDSEMDDKVMFLLSDLQRISNLPDAISRVEVSARTKPEDAFARVDPDTLSPAQKEIWYCRPYANSIAYQIREAIPSADAQQVRQVEQSEGTILSRISGFMWLISAAALLAAAFAVSAAMATAILERQSEIGLMRSLGAPRSTIALLFYSESALLALVTGTLGYLFGSALAAWLGVRIFASQSASQTAALSHLTASQVFIPVLLPVVVAVALIVAIAGSAPSIRAALKLDPSLILRADA